MRLEHMKRSNRIRSASLNAILFLVCVAVLQLAAIPSTGAQTRQAGVASDGTGHGRHAISGNLSLNYSQVEASDFPRIVSYVTVLDATGSTVGGLTKDNFTVYEDDVFESPIRVEEIADTSNAVSVVLAMDRSGSMEEEIEDAKQAASTFVRLMGGNDQAALVSFSTEVTTEHGFTNDKNSLIGAISKLKARGGTALYDAALVSADLLARVTGRRAIILLTDGRDKDSHATVDDVVRRFSSLGIPIYAIGLGTEVEEDNLRAISQASGGRYFFSPSSSDLEEIYRLISTLLRHSYRITYATHNRTTDGTLRHVRIEVHHSGDSARGNNTYRAPDHVPTIAPMASEAPSPGREFVLDIAIPPQSKIMYNLHELRVAVRYDPAYLRVQEPSASGIVPASFFGQPSEYSFDALVDTAKAKIVLRFQRDAALPPAEGRGVLAQIKFRAALDMPDSTALSFRIINLTAADNTGWPVAVRSEDLSLQSYGLIVWPGDTNHNGTVELTDVLVLGMYWHIAGPPRTGPGDQNEWRPQLAGRYPEPAVAHADADGSGRVDERDLFPIGLNWRRTRADAAVTKTQVVEAPDGEVSIELQPGDRSGEYRLRLDFSNSNQAPLAGFAFRLNYPASQIVIQSAEAGACWGSSPLIIQHDDPASSMFAMALMIPAGSPANASSGTLVELVLHVTKRLAGEEFQLQDVALVSPSGDIRELAPASMTKAARQNLPLQFSLHPVFPNPLRTSAAGSTIQYDLSENAVVRVAVFNAAGQQVRLIADTRATPGRHSVQWRGRNDLDQQVGSGLYFVRVNAVGESGRSYQAIQKVALVK